MRSKYLRGAITIGVASLLAVTGSSLAGGFALPPAAASPATQVEDNPNSEQPDLDIPDPETPAPETPTPETPVPEEPEPPATPENPDDSENTEPGGENEELPNDESDEQSETSDEVEQPEEEAISLTPNPLAANSRLAASPAATLGDTRNGRLSGLDRYATAVAVSKHAYAKTADTVIIATGLDYPDSLSAAALGAKLRAPLLLTNRTSLPSVTRSEIKRLKPKTIVIVGGTGVVSAGVERSLKSAVSSIDNVVRIGGSDRYATSAAISRHGWPEGAKSVFVATGTNYADALAAGAAAGKLGVPVLLVPGTSDSAPKSVRTESSRLKHSRVYIAGGTAIVNSSVQKSVANGSPVTRYWGADRFETSAKIANGIFPKGTRATYFAYGFGYADALTGAAVAGAEGSPLLLTQSTCIPSTVYSASDARKPNQSFLVGGKGVLANAVQHGDECMKRPSKISNSSWSSAQKLYSRINVDRWKAGLAGARVADSRRGTPANDWAKSKRISFNNSLKTQQPWVRFEGSARSSSSGNRVTANYNRFYSDATAKKWLLRKTNGSRTFVSVGFYSANPQSYATIYVGTGL